MDPFEILPAIKAPTEFTPQKKADSITYPLRWSLVAFDHFSESWRGEGVKSLLYIMRGGDIYRSGKKIIPVIITGKEMVPLHQYLLFQVSTWLKVGKFAIFSYL